MERTSVTPPKTDAFVIIHFHSSGAEKLRLNPTSCFSQQRPLMLQEGTLFLSLTFGFTALTFSR